MTIPFSYLNIQLDKVHAVHDGAKSENMSVWVWKNTFPWSLWDLALLKLTRADFNNLKSIIFIKFLH